MSLRPRGQGSGISSCFLSLKFRVSSSGADFGLWLSTILRAIAVPELLCLVKMCLALDLATSAFYTHGLMAISDYQTDKFAGG